MMFVKKKHALVIILSSIVVAVVFVSTLIGYSLYIQWKKDTFALKYRSSIYKLTAELFSGSISISNMSVKIGDNKLFPEIPFVEGNLKNNSGKTITSAAIEVLFLMPDGRVAYNDWFDPLERRHSGSPALFPGMKQTGNALLPGESMSFRHPLRNCPDEVTSHFSTRAKFAKDSPEDGIELVYSIMGLSVL